MVGLGTGEGLFCKDYVYILLTDVPVGDITDHVNPDTIEKTGVKRIVSRSGIDGTPRRPKTIGETLCH